MYNIHARQWAPCQLLTGRVWRVDSRPPYVIKQSGFAGTENDSHLFAAFEQQTVFGSLTIAGACTFQKVMWEGGIILPYLYGINVMGLRGYVFRSNHTGSLNYQSSQRLARVNFERREAVYQHNPIFRYLGQEAMINQLAEKLAGRINIAFAPVNEVHVLGPIEPGRITPYSAYSDDMLPAPVATLAPSARRNSI